MLSRAVGTVRCAIAHRALWSIAFAVAFSAPALLSAQMVVSGRVTVSGQGVAGATVGIPSLDIETSTTSDGQYNFLVRAALVRGQVVTLTARHRRHGSQSVPLQLTGGTVTRDFTLGNAATSAASAPPRPRESTAAAPVVAGAAAGKTRSRDDGRLVARSLRMLDSTAMEDLAGPVDLGSALAGRIPGLLISSATALGGSAPMWLRGARSIVRSSHPLVVLDGVPLDLLGAGAAAQQVGLGGFDYGTPLQDIALDDIGTITLLDPATAAVLYGSRAANGVIVVTSRSAAPGTGLQIAVRQRYTRESPLRLPSYQNRYGQGLGGQFEFFDGMGGGINDAVDQSWGPALDGQPVAQASYTEPRMAEVRYWLPARNSLKDYFERGHTYDAIASVSAASAVNGLRVGINARDAGGVTPGTSARRIGLALGSFSQPSARLSVTANVNVVGSRANGRPGTGYDEINPVAGLTRFGRQVDLPTLRANTRSGTEQINWIYTARNNPWVQPLENTNSDRRTHFVAGATGSYELTDWLGVSVRGGIDDVDETRSVGVAPGWKGGFPTILGRADFSAGGVQTQTVNSSERLAQLALRTRALSVIATELTGTAGIESRTGSFRTNGTVSDAALPAGGTQASEDVSGSTTAVFAAGTAQRAGFWLSGGVRLERSPAFRSDYGWAVFPAAALSYDLARLLPGSGSRIGTVRIRASWWRAGSELSDRTRSQAYVSAATTSPMLGLPAGDGTLPERTTGTEVGAELSTAGRRVELDLSVYQERSSELLLALGGGTSFAAAQSGEISNSGVELALRGVPLRLASTTLETTVSFARNVNRVEEIAAGVAQVPLSPSLWGAFLVAREGSPLGAIAGTRYLRDAGTGALILRNGLPIPDAGEPLTVLGSWHPDWTASVANRLHIGNTELSLLIDGRKGGKIFSATNLWGSFAGTLSATLPYREGGMVVSGVDSATGGANIRAVDAEDYFHALGAIHEAWVYDASFIKVREARVSYERLYRNLPRYTGQTLRVSLIARNLLTWARAPNIDPETALSAGAFQGFEMGQLPTTRSLGLQLTLTP